jgi:hypothetical protein
MKITANLLIIAMLWSVLPAVAQTTDNRGVAVKPNTLAEKRLALVIGNGNYQFTDKLKNPVNDANDMAEALKKLGFEVISGTDLTLAQMRKLVREFGNKLQQQKSVGLFYYAGHGIQVNGNNYLVPVDANIETAVETPDYSMDSDTVLRFMREAGNEFNMVILDACRNNPFARSWRSLNPNRSLDDDKGLARITPPSGTVILYSTEPGKVASDGTGRNGLFTESLLSQINKPNIEFDAMVKLLSREVKTKSGGKQSAWKEGLYDGEFYFKIDGVSLTTTKPPQEITTIIPKPQPVIEVNVEDIYWNDVNNRNTKSAYELYLSEYPNGKYGTAARQKVDGFKREEARKQKEIETNKWDEALSLNRKSAYQSYLTQYPDGEFAISARNKIKEFETEEAKVLKSQQELADKNDWGKADKLKTIDGYKDYLKTHPNGNYAKLARLGLSSLGEDITVSNQIPLSEEGIVADKARLYENCFLKDKAYASSNADIKKVAFRCAKEYLVKYEVMDKNDSDKSAITNYLRKKLNIFEGRTTSTQIPLTEEEINADKFRLYENCFIKIVANQRAYTSTDDKVKKAAYQCAKEYLEKYEEMDKDDPSKSVLTIFLRKKLDAYQR